ncbi:MAG: hypothetical protein WA021_00650 [Minisyncoccia bacterium]
MDEIKNGKSLTERVGQKVRETAKAAVVAGALLMGTPDMSIEIGGYEISLSLIQSAEAQNATPGTNSPEFKKEIQAFYKYIFDESDVSKQFRQWISHEGHVMKIGDVKSQPIPEKNLQSVLNSKEGKAYPLMRAKNFKSGTVNINKIDHDKLLITMILVTGDGKTNTTTVIARPKSKLKGRSDEE